MDGCDERERMHTDRAQYQIFDETRKLECRHNLHIGGPSARTNGEGVRVNGERVRVMRKCEWCETRGQSTS